MIKPFTIEEALMWTDGLADAHDFDNLPEREIAMACNPTDVFEPCPVVYCPCSCGGLLEADGINKAGTHTFLHCNKCKCTYMIKNKIGD